MREDAGVGAFLGDDDDDEWEGVEVREGDGEGPSMPDVDDLLEHARSSGDGEALTLYSRAWEAGDRQRHIDANYLVDGGLNPGEHRVSLEGRARKAKGARAVLLLALINTGYSDGLNGRPRRGL